LSDFSARLSRNTIIISDDDDDDYDDDDDDDDNDINTKYMTVKHDSFSPQSYSLPLTLSAAAVHPSRSISEIQNRHYYYRNAQRLRRRR